ncbi:efflux RND transporter permease subunit [Marinoscillum furvescens]|uniref:Multidrug efflux pump subunit AcrB n=1 Tax=Marinoscillum furvescens DSM 4134 TaxID=1122208 RepID=A0A3D9L3Z2_MARFU|nr:efflux RND transporter permease subunit [Marinoscillum furvescens]RED98408.1 multidrug efflux pump subunit AcrB [Marinoscillum furvescens DSM 4134]
MIRFLVDRPVSVIMVFIAIVVLGAVSFQQIPVSLMPDVEIPEITIQVAAPEQSAHQVEENYIHLIRRQLLQVGHLADMESYAYNEYGYIRLKFDYGTRLHYAFIEVNEKIDALMQRMPEGFERPRVIKASATDIPVFYLTLALKDQNTDGLGNRFMELSEFAEQVIKRRIEQLDEVAMVDISGMEYPEIHVEVDLQKLGALGMDPWVLKKTMEENNLSSSNIKVRNGLYEFNVKYSSLLTNRHDIENLMLRSGGRVFKLSEIATITVVPRSSKGFVLDKTGKAISMAVIKKSNARMEQLRERTDELLEAIRTDYPRITIEQNRNQTQLLAYAISSLKSSLWIGGTLAFLVLLVFLNDFRSPLLIGISIPVSLVISLLFFYLLGISINVISLSGLIVGIGLMIDNSIIVIDNIGQHIARRESAVHQASASATTEVIAPLLSSAMTTCAVFVPLIFLGGIAGALFYDQALSITIGLASSLVVSVALIPVLYVVLGQQKVLSRKWSRREGSRLANTYELGYQWVMGHQKVFVGATIILLLVGMLAYRVLPKERFPAMEKSELLIAIDWNESITKAENGKRVTQLVQEVDSLLLSVSAMVGEQWFLLDHTANLSGTQASIFLECQSADGVRTLREQVVPWVAQNYPEAALELKAPESIFDRVFGNGQAPVEVRLTAENSTGLPDPEKVRSVESLIKRQTGMPSESKQALQQVYELRPHFEKLLLYEVGVDRLMGVLQVALGRFPAFQLKQGQYEVPVVITERTKDLHSILSQTLVPSRKGAQIPASELVEVHIAVDYKGYTGDKSGAYVPLDYQVSEKGADHFIASVKRLIAADGQLKASFAGSVLDSRLLISELWVTFLVALLLLYFILASQFESLLQPLIVFLELPIGVASALVALWGFGQSINLMSLIGIIVMSGIIINDSILKIDTINRLRKAGHSVDTAIQMAGKRRLKAIIMTSATTILAMVPFLWGQDMGAVLQRPLAVAVIGGMLIGTFVSLYFIPVAYKLIYSSLKASKQNEAH